MSWAVVVVVGGRPLLGRKAEKEAERESVCVYIQRGEGGYGYIVQRLGRGPSKVGGNVQEVMKSKAVTEQGASSVL